MRSLIPTARAISISSLVSMVKVVMPSISAGQRPASLIAAAVASQASCNSERPEFFENSVCADPDDRSFILEGRWASWSTLLIEAELLAAEPLSHSIRPLEHWARLLPEGDLDGAGHVIPPGVLARNLQHDHGVRLSSFLDHSEPVMTSWCRREGSEFRA